jgi:hypothetical protein
VWLLLLLLLLQQLLLCLLPLELRNTGQLEDALLHSGDCAAHSSVQSRGIQTRSHRCALHVHKSLCCKPTPTSNHTSCGHCWLED